MSDLPDSAVVVDAAPAPALADAGDPGTTPVIPPPIVTYDASPWGEDPNPGSTTDDAGVSDPGDNTGSGQGGSSSDGAAGPADPPPSNSGSGTADAGGSSADAGAPATTFDAGTGTKPVDAGYTPPQPAPMCQASTCNNDCGLRLRCCTLTNQCACMSLLGFCIIPSRP